MVGPETLTNFPFFSELSENGRYQQKLAYFMENPLKKDDLYRFILVYDHEIAGW